MERRQSVCGVDFVYNPPPRKKMPHAAGVESVSAKCALARHIELFLSER